MYHDQLLLCTCSQQTTMVRPSLRKFLKGGGGAKQASVRLRGARPFYCVRVNTQSLRGLGAYSFRKFLHFRLPEIAFSSTNLMLRSSCTCTCTCTYIHVHVALFSRHFECYYWYDPIIFATIIHIMVIFWLYASDNTSFARPPSPQMKP